MNKNRFDLEQEILDCWKLTDDINLLVDRSVGEPFDIQDFRALAKVYEHKFNKMWETFEFMVGDKQIITK
jgi:hypothetical protein